MLHDQGSEHSEALRLGVSELIEALASDEDQSRFISAQAEMRLLALLALIRGLTWGEADLRTLEHLRGDWFERRPWYHRVVADVAIYVAAGWPIPDEFYVNLGVGDSSVREWLIEVGWLIREQLEVQRAINELGRNAELWQVGAWTGLLRWLIERHGHIGVRALADYEPRESIANYQRRLTRFFADGEGHDEVKRLEKVESDAMGETARWLGLVQ